MLVHRRSGNFVTARFVKPDSAPLRQAASCPGLGQIGAAQMHEVERMFVPFWLGMAHAPADATRAGPPRLTWPRLRIVSRKDARTVTGAGALRIEFAEFAAAEAVRSEWTALLDRALEPNIFAEPAFALAAAQHFAESRRPLFLLVRDRDGEDGSPGALLCVWPIEGRPSALSPQIVRGWCTSHAVVGAPVIDRSRAAEVADAVFAALANRFGARSLLLAPQLLRAGPTYGLLVSRALATGRIWGTLSAHSRAVLRSGPTFTAAARPRNFTRMLRRLEAAGAVSYHSATTPDDLRVATEEFLTLEESGWKGRRATALLSQSDSVTFARSMLRQLAHAGHLRIDSLKIDGRPIAMSVILNSRGRAYYWKIAFDEGFAAASPGLLLSLDVTRRQNEDAQIAETDSCAMPGSPMIERIWQERQEMADIAIATMPGTQGGAVGTLRRERFRRQAREWAKRIVRNDLPRALDTLRLRRRTPPQTNGSPNRA